MTDDFSNHPKSISEIRSERTNHQKDWTVRDMLIATLRDIDAGEINPDRAILILAQPDPIAGEDEMNIRRAGDLGHITTGGMLLSAMKADF